MKDLILVEETRYKKPRTLNDDKRQKMESEISDILIKAQTSISVELLYKGEQNGKF